MYKILLGVMLIASLMACSNPDSKKGLSPNTQAQIQSCLSSCYDSCQRALNDNLYTVCLNSCYKKCAILN